MCIPFRDGYLVWEGWEGKEEEGIDEEEKNRRREEQMRRGEWKRKNIVYNSIVYV